MMTILYGLLTRIPLGITSGPLSLQVSGLECFRYFTIGQTSSKTHKFESHSNNFSDKRDNLLAGLKDASNVCAVHLFRSKNLATQLMTTVDRMLRKLNH